MSESNSTPLPVSRSISGDDADLTEDQLTDGFDLGFDGAEDVLRAWRRGMRPDPDLTVSEWKASGTAPSRLPWPAIFRMLGSNKYQSGQMNVL